jgi:hypothetical protein
VKERVTGGAASVARASSLNSGQKASSMRSKPANGKQKIMIPTTSCRALRSIAAWACGQFVAGGGLLLLWTKRPWPLTNGWVRPAFGRFGLSGNGLVPKNIRGGHGLRLCSAGRCGSVFRRGENCFGGRKLIGRLFPVKIRTETASLGSICPSPPTCTIMILLAAGPDGRCCKTEESPNSAEQCAG